MEKKDEELFDEYQESDECAREGLRGVELDESIVRDGGIMEEGIIRNQSLLSLCCVNGGSRLECWVGEEIDKAMDKLFQYDIECDMGRWWHTFVIRIPSL